MTQQFYLVTVAKLMTADECDIVPSWSAYIAEDKINDLTLNDVAQLLTVQLKDAPTTNLRPMTEPEIKAWREEQ